MNEELMAEISRVWTNHPSLRLGQLICDAVYLHKRSTKRQLDLFYMSDIDLILVLKIRQLAVQSNTCVTLSFSRTHCQIGNEFMKSHYVHH